MEQKREIERDIYRERVWEREGKREQDEEWERESFTQFEGGSINGPSNRGRVGLTVKLDGLLLPSMTFDY